MRRQDRQITDQSQIDAIIKKAVVCRLAMVDPDSNPYIVPLCFGYQDYVLYVHSALIGKKIEILKHNPAVCFEVDIPGEPVNAAIACNWSMPYQSVIGCGRAVFLEDVAEKKAALSIIMAQYSDQVFEFSDNNLKATAVIKIIIDSMTGKQLRLPAV